MQTVMILSGGTSTAWHIADVLQRHFRSHIFLIICDINPKQLVHTSVFADTYIQVPPICDPAYYDHMIRLISEYHVDLIVPLIDDDIFIFSEDNPDLVRMGVRSTAPCRDVIEALSNKENLENTLHRLGISTPITFKRAEDIDPAATYFTKAVIGCGSRGSKLIDGATALKFITKGSGQIVQEVCFAPEITVDVVHDSTMVFTACRERIETKLGVSTKCRVYHDDNVQHMMERVVMALKLPTAFCVQFMHNSSGQLSLTDFNLRSGGGTAISAAAGFDMIRFAAAHWLGLPADPAWVSTPVQEHYIVRAYQEIITQ